MNGIFASERERLNVLGMLLENLGIDKVVPVVKRFEDLDLRGWTDPEDVPS